MPVSVKTKYDIRHRITGEILWTGDAESLKTAAISAVDGDADLSGADLSGADLSDADLRGADLRGADLRDAGLRGADLSGADLRGADLRGADLRGADLRDAGLRGADLSGADLRGADLSGADLSGADLSGADLSGADLSGAGLRGADLSGADLSGADLSGADLRGADIPVIENIDAKILAACTAEGCNLDMGSWHKCQTTHCRAGWAIHLAGEAGKELENKFGSDCAGSMIYAVSRPDKRIPNFYASDSEAMADLVACANEGK